MMGINFEEFEQELKSEGIEEDDVIVDDEGNVEIADHEDEEEGAEEEGAEEEGAEEEGAEEGAEEEVGSGEEESTEENEEASEEELLLKKNLNPLPNLLSFLYSQKNQLEIKVQPYAD